METIVVLLTRDLRVHDNPALHLAATAARGVVPLFVVDPRIRSSPNRRRFLAESLADLRTSLRARGSELVIRHGDPAAEAVRLARSVGAQRIFAAADASGYAARRQRRLADGCNAERLDLSIVDTITVVPPGRLRPAGGGEHYRVFTPYWRAWRAHPRRRELPAPRRLAMPEGVAAGALPESGPGGSPDVLPGGETAGRRRLAGWRRHRHGYAANHDNLAADATSRLGAYLHFGCVSAISVLAAAGDAEEFVQQLCWRDFYHQVLADYPALTRDRYRPGSADEWRHDPDALARWQSGHTGLPIVDAGLRQLADQGFLPNRARLIAATYLTKVLELDWRDGARWFADWLLDADVANNYGNWQWVAGTGNDPRPNRRFNPLRQAHRFDPAGDYVRRWVPELAGLAGHSVHQPWRHAAAPAGYRREPPLFATRERWA